MQESIYRESCFAASTHQRQFFRVRPLHREPIGLVDSATPIVPTERAITSSLSRLSLPKASKRKRREVGPTTVQHQRPSRGRVLRLELQDYDASFKPELYRCYPEAWSGLGELGSAEIDSDCPTDQEQVECAQARFLGELRQVLSRYPF